MSGKHGGCFGNCFSDICEGNNIWIFIILIIIVFCCCGNNDSDC